MLRKPTTVARRLAQCQSRRTQKGTARSTNLESAAPTTAWHVRSPEQLALITTLGNLASLGSAATHDHIMVRLLAGLSSMVSVSYNLLMPKPLKAHQTTAAAWSCVFAVLHFANFALLVRENQHSTELTDEQEDIYEHGFQIHGVTPRQFRLLLNSGARFRDYDAGETIVELGKPVDKVIYITHGSCVGERGAGCVCLEYHQAWQCVAYTMLVVLERSEKQPWVPKTIRQQHPLWFSTIACPGENRCSLPEQVAKQSASVTLYLTTSNTSTHPSADAQCPSVQVIKDSLDTMRLDRS